VFSNNIANIAFSSLILFLFVSSSGITAEDSDAGIQWILDRYQVSEPVSLIPKKGLDGWTTHYGKDAAQTKWSNKDGKLVLDLDDKDHEHGDLVTAKPYTNFILDFAWIASKGCNSGVKFRLKDFGEIGAKVNYSKTFGWLGCEYQILDDSNNGEGKKGQGQWAAASLYSMFAPDKEKKRLNPHGKANEGRIVVLDNHIEHWLNGEKVLEYDIGSDVWNKALAEGKFARAKKFGANPTGFIMLQDHGHTVSFEKIEIREIVRKK
jgi:hypothetical protein